MAGSSQVILEHQRKKKRFAVRPLEVVRLACHFSRVRVAKMALRPGDFVRVTCKRRTAIVFNSFRAFNRGTIHLRRGEFVTFIGDFRRKKSRSR
ncbi:hypothetical protein JOD24_002136 [Kroppenstedtia sanguinis]|uniref:Uncharacterized protein n=1 Tax=Kroppenstedtia sanguinis TaxID=1380684 RepID=A0ABW4C6H9_9BACL